MTTEAITYDDITLIPQYSEIASRHDCDISTTMSVGDNEIEFKMPLIGAPMDTVCGPKMCHELYQNGAIGVLHRYNTLEEQVELYKQVKDEDADCFVALGANGEFMLRADALYNAGARMFCIDVAHGNHLFVRNTIISLRKKYGDEIHIMAGNVCDETGAYNCFSWGADSIRVGVGGGSVCTTRLVTGHGVPNLTAIELAVKAKSKIISEYQKKNGTFFPKKLYVIADGGIRRSGDAAKALAFGANFVMVGSMLAGTEETPPVQEHRRNKVLGGHNMVPHNIEYRGMASKDAQKANGRVSIVEGISATIRYKGLVKDVLETFSGGLRSALSYTGVDNLEDFVKKARFVHVSTAAKYESHPHVERIGK